MKCFISIGFFIIQLHTFAQISTFVTVPGGDLYSTDLINCTRDYRGSTGISFGDIAFTSNGKLWGVYQSEIYEIDTTTAITTFVGQTTLFAVSLVGLNDTLLLAESGQNLYTINTQNATSSLIGNIGYTAIGDLTWHNNKLYMSAGLYLIEIELNASNTAIVNINKVGSEPNGLFSSMGLMTGSFKTCPNAVVAFYEDDVYRINTTTGETELMCTSVFPETVPGAASITYAVNPGELHIPNVFTPNGDGINDFFHFQNNTLEVLEIKNRWGNTVYEWTNTNPSWDGKNNATNCSDGVYYYLITLNECDIRESYSGAITLIR